MMQNNLTILAVFEQGGKQVGYEVKRSDGSRIKVDKSGIINAARNGYNFTNATVSQSGIIRVNGSVPRKPVSSLN